MIIKQGPFGLAEGLRDNLPYFVVVKKGYCQFESKQDYQWFLMIEISADAGGRGLISGEEGEVLNGLEDAIEQKIQQATDGYFVARITWNGKRNIYYYVKNAEKAAKELDSIIEKKEYTREFEYRIEKDVKWEKMTGIIPNIEELQAMDND